MSGGRPSVGGRWGVDEVLARARRDALDRCALDEPCDDCVMRAAVLADLRAALADLSIDGNSDLRIVGGTERLLRLLAPREGAEP